MPITRQHTFANKAVVSGSDLDEEFDNIAAHHAAGHTTGDMAAAAGVLPAQLSAAYEHLDIQMVVTGADLDASEPPIDGWPATTLVKAVPLVAANGETPWVVTDVYWMCSDIGGSVGTFRIEWGVYSDLTAGTGTAVTGTITMNATQGSSTGLTVSLTPTATPMGLGLYAIGADAAAVDADIFSFMSVSIRCRRYLATG